MFAIALAAFLLSGQDPSSQRSASDLTRDLNSGPPVRPTSSGQASPAQPAAPVSAPALASAEPGGTPAVSTAVREGSAVTRDLNSAPPSSFRPSASASAPVPAAPASAAPVSAIPPASTAPRVQPLSAPAPSDAARPAPAPVRAASSPSSSAPARPATGPQGLDAASIAALPFTLELPSDVVVTQSRAGADAQIYAVRRGQTPLVMIYAGPASQFPIFDGQMVQAGGRASVVVSEGGRRLALEHLFRRSAAPEEIHVWVAAPDGADRDLGERIAQSVDAR